MFYQELNFPGSSWTFWSKNTWTSSILIFCNSRLLASKGLKTAKTKTKTLQHVKLVTWRRSMQAVNSEHTESRWSSLLSVWLKGQRSAAELVIKWLPGGLVPLCLYITHSAGVFPADLHSSVMSHELVHQKHRTSITRRVWPPPHHQTHLQRHIGSWSGVTHKRQQNTLQQLTWDHHANTPRLWRAASSAAVNRALDNKARLSHLGHFTNQQHAPHSG